MPRLKVYVACASNEIERARRATITLRSLPHIEVVSTWIQVIEAVGEANPIDATDDDRRAWAANDLVEVDSADVLFFLVPPRGSGAGAWVEFGFAFARHATIVAAGEGTHSIFTPLAQHAYANDETAIEAIATLAALRGAGREG